MLSNSNFSESGIPRSEVPFLGTTKKLHGNFTFLFLIVTMHTSNCGMLELLYTLNLTVVVYVFLSFCKWHSWEQGFKCVDGH